MAILVRLSGGRWGGAWAAQTESVHEFRHESLSFGTENRVNIATTANITEPSHDRHHVFKMVIIDAAAKKIHVRASKEDPRVKTEMQLD